MKKESKSVEVLENHEVIELPNQYIVPVNPFDAMIEKALTSEVDMDKLERIINLRKDHEKDEARKAYFSAFAAFSENPPEIKKSVEVKYQNSDGSWTVYYHADLGESLQIIKAALAPHGLSISFKQKQENGLLTVTCFLTHRLGYQESTSLSSAPDTSGGKSGIQGTASTDSYLKRYTSFAITGLHAVGEDDDARSAEEKPKVSNLVKMTPEYKTLQETKELFPEEYKIACENAGGEPINAEQCLWANDAIKKLVDEKDQQK